MGHYRSLFVLVDSNGFSWVLIGPYSFLCILLHTYVSF